MSQRISESRPRTGHRSVPWPHQRHGVCQQQVKRVNRAFVSQQHCLACLLAGSTSFRSAARRLPGSWLQAADARAEGELRPALCAWALLVCSQPGVDGSKWCSHTLACHLTSHLTVCPQRQDILNEISYIRFQIDEESRKQGDMHDMLESYESEIKAIQVCACYCTQASISTAAGVGAQPNTDATLVHRTELPYQSLLASLVYDTCVLCLPASCHRNVLR